MTFNDIARHHLDSFGRGEAPEGGLARFDELRALDLDGSLESIDRLDAFLLRLHGEGFADEIDLDEASHQNFLFLIAFALGRAAGERAGREPNWVTWSAVVESNPGLKNEIPEVFGSSVMCLLGNALYMPLSVAMARLYEGPQAEGLRASVEDMSSRGRSAAS